MSDSCEAIEWRTTIIGNHGNGFKMINNQKFMLEDAWALNHVSNKQILEVKSFI